MDRLDRMVIIGRWLSKSIFGANKNKNIAKGTTDPRVEFILQVLTQILIKFHLQNLEQVSTSRSQPNMNISTKVKLKNIDQTKPQNLDLDSTL